MKLNFNFFLFLFYIKACKYTNKLYTSICLFIYENLDATHKILIPHHRTALYTYFLFYFEVCVVFTAYCVFGPIKFHEN